MINKNFLQILNKKLANIKAKINTIILLYQKNLLKTFIIEEIKLAKIRSSQRDFISELFQMSVEDAKKKMCDKEWERIKNLYKKEK